MPPSVRKPSLAIRRGCLGVPHPPAAAPRLRVSVWPAKGAPPLRAARAPSDALRPTAARASPHRVGGGSRTGPGPASPARFCRPRCCGRVWRLNAPRGEVWGGAAPPPPPPASPRRAALRPLPSRAAAGGRRAGMGWGRLARGGRSPGVWVSGAATGRLEREKDRRRWGIPSAARRSRGGSPVEGVGQRPGSREGARGRSASWASRGRPSVWRWDPRAFSRWPACVLGPSLGVLRRAARALVLGGSRLARGLLPAAAHSPFRVRALTEAGLPPRGCRRRPYIGAGGGSPRRGAPRAR